LIENKMYQARYSEKWMYETAEHFTALAQEEGYEPASLAVAWAGAHPAITAPIIGARNPEQLKSSLLAMEVNMTPTLWQKIADLSYQPPPSTDRNEEKSEFNYGIR